MGQTVTNEGDHSGITSERFQAGTEDVVILPMVAIALVVKYGSAVGMDGPEADH